MSPTSASQEEIERLGARLDEFAAALSDRERAALIQLVASSLDPLARAGLRKPAELFSEEELRKVQAILGES